MLGGEGLTPQCEAAVLGGGYLHVPARPPSPRSDVPAALRLSNVLADLHSNGDERRRRAEHGGVGTPHSRGASGKGLGASSDKASLFSWRLRAGRFVGSVTRRRGGPPAHRPSGGGPGCGFASDHAIPAPSQAGGAFVLRVVELSAIPQLPT